MIEDKTKEEYHVSFLLKMLESDEPCMSINCPSNLESQEHERLTGMFKVTYDCDLCRKFLDLPKKGVLADPNNDKSGHRCPCFALGSDKAIELTWQKLKERGYVR